MPCLKLTYYYENITSVNIGVDRNELDFNMAFDLSRIRLGCQKISNPKVTHDQLLLGFSMSSFQLFTSNKTPYLWVKSYLYKQYALH